MLYISSIKAKILIYEGLQLLMPVGRTPTKTRGVSALMAYRDFAEGRDSITYHTEHEVEYANEIGAKAVIGVETQYLEPYEKVSFFEEGEAYMNKQLQIVDQIYFGQLGYGGQAVHKYQSYQTMKP